VKAAPPFNLDHALAMLYDEDKKKPILRLLPMRDIDQVAPAGAINSSAADMGRNGCA